MMFDHDEKDYWEISRKGIESFEGFRDKFSSGALPVGRCYLWTPTFKLLMHPEYRPSERDLTRPWDEYA
jgi:hypothetical protein